MNIIDVAPTVLDLLGIDAPDSMHGRTMESVSSDATVATRIGNLAAGNQDSLFRDDQAGIAAGIVFAVGLLLALATGALVGRVERVRAFLTFGALWLLGFLAATFLAGPFHFARHGGAAAYWAFVIGVAVVLAVVAWLAGRRLGHPADAVLVALGILVTLHIVDLITGAHLELNTVFGYSATFDVRVGGVSGWAFAQLTAAAGLFAGLLVWRVPSSTGRRIAFAVLAISVLVIGAPFFGNDFEGMVVAAIAFGLLAWCLAGRALRPLPATAAVVVVPRAGSRGGRRGERARQRTRVTRPGPRSRTCRCSSTRCSSAWCSSSRCCSRTSGTCARSHCSDLVDAIPTARPTMLALVIVAALGIVLNDPGVSIPGMMAVVLESAVVHLTARPPRRAPDERAKTGA